MAIATGITLDNVRLLCDFTESDKEHTDPLISLLIYAKNCPKTIESLEEYLRKHIGVKVVPLSYVLIPEEAVSPSSDEPETSFSSAED